MRALGKHLSRKGTTGLGPALSTQSGEADATQVTAQPISPQCGTSGKDYDVQDELAIISESWKNAFLELGVLFRVFCFNGDNFLSKLA